jgi:hypothetical protein
MKNHYVRAADTVHGMDTGWQNVGTWMPGLPATPSTVSVTPSSGSGAFQTFTYLYSDASGYQNISNVYSILNTTLSDTGSCSVSYLASNHSLYLAQDGGSSWLGPVTISQAGTLQNSQCTVDAGASSASGSGTNLTVNLAISFSSSFVGLKNHYMRAFDVINNLDSGWQNRGAWTPNPATTPSAVLVSPSSGSGTPQTFTYLYSNADGYQNITNAYALLGDSSSWTNSCGVMYVPQSKGLSLMKDDGSGWLGPITIGQTGTLQNSQCTLNGGGSSASGSGTNLTLNLAISFSSSFFNMKKHFMRASDVAHNLDSGWQDMGTWVPNMPATPSAVSVSPSSGSGTSQTFTYLYSDASGYQNISGAFAILNTTLSDTGSCSVSYLASNHSLYLAQDGGSSWLGPVVIGQAGTLHNSQCTVNVGASSVSGSGTNLTVNLALSFSSSFVGAKYHYMRAVDGINNLDSGWQKRGTWTVGP